MYEYLLENEGNHWWHVGKYACAVRFLKRYTVGKPRLLELGSSFGTLSRLCNKFTRSFALDSNFDVLKIGAYGLSICGDATKLPFKNDCFDTVAALDLLEHIKNDILCLEEIIRVLKPKGTIFLFVPAYPILWSDLDEIGRHYRRYTPKRLKGLLSSFANIRIKKFTHFNTFLFTPILFIRVLQKIMKRKLERISTESMAIPPEPINYILKKCFLLEGRLVYRLNFPVGVSLIAIAEKGDAICEAPFLGRKHL